MTDISPRYDSLPMVEQEAVSLKCSMTDISPRYNSLPMVEHEAVPLKCHMTDISPRYHQMTNGRTVNHIMSS